jgi:hypothetical protein
MEWRRGPGSHSPHERHTLSGLNTSYQASPLKGSTPPNNTTLGSKPLTHGSLGVIQDLNCSTENILWLTVFLQLYFWNLSVIRFHCCIAELHHNLLHIYCWWYIWYFLFFFNSNGTYLSFSWCTCAKDYLEVKLQGHSICTFTFPG